MELLTTYLFGNIFNDERITTGRLLAFANDTINRLTAQNTTGDFTALLALLTPPTLALQNQVSSVDVALGIQKGKTLTLNQFVTLFKKTMSDKEGVIADAVGGYESAAYIEFYPAGLNEYSQATKLQIQLLTDRLDVAAEKYKAKLGATLTATLKAFKTQWTTYRSTQQQQKGSVSDSRADRNVTRTATETALLQAIHTVALKYPADVARCTSLFNFSLLYKSIRTNKQTFSGSVAPGAAKLVVQNNFTDLQKITIENTSTLPLVVWLAATATETSSTQGITVQPKQKLQTKAANLGNVATHTFLQIHNPAMPTGKEVSYIVSYNG
jgi:hypothetical protein